MEKIIFDIAGWVLFIASAIGFIISAWGSGDYAALSGGWLFLLACFVFLWPLVQDLRRAKTPPTSTA